MIASKKPIGATGENFFKNSLFSMKFYHLSVPAKSGRPVAHVDPGRAFDSYGPACAHLCPIHWIVKENSR